MNISELVCLIGVVVIFIIMGIAWFIIMYTNKLDCNAGLHFVKDEYTLHARSTDLPKQKYLGFRKHGYYD